MQTHQAKCFVNWVVCGKVSTFKFQVIVLSVLAFGFSWVLCNSYMPAHNFRIDQQCVNMLGPLWSSLFIHISAKHMLAPAMTSCSRANGSPFLSVAKDHHFHWQCHWPWHHLLLPINWTTSTWAVKLPSSWWPYPGKTSVLTNLERMERAQGNNNTVLS